MRELAGEGTRAVADRARDVARAADGSVEADEEQPGPDRGAACESQVPPREGHCAQPQPEEQIAGGEDEHAAPVCAEAARPDDDEDAHGHERQQSGASNAAPSSPGTRSSVSTWFEIP